MDRVAANLRSRLHSVYAQQPAKTLALRVRHADGLAWEIDGHVLTVTTGAGITTLDLRNYTIGSLATELMVRGHDVEYRTQEIDHLSAIILMEGSGNQDASNGDHLYAYTSLIWVLLGATGVPYGEARSAVTAALRQLILPQSRNEWADLFGVIFGIPRDVGESDAVYTQRIIWEVQRRRSNPFAISANIHYRTGYSVSVREPWQEIFMLSESPLDDDFYLQGAPIWQYHTAQVVATTGVDWARVKREANADRPAGTIYLDPATHYPPRGIVVDGLDLTAWQEATRARQVWMVNDGVLSVNLDLSNYQSILNHPFIIYELVMLYCGPPADVAIWANPDPEMALWLGGWDTRPWQSLYERVFYPPINTYAGIVILSDGSAMGDLQTHFAGAMPVEVGEPLRPSDIGGLSDYEYRVDSVPIDVWSEALQAAWIEVGDVDVGMATSEVA